MRGVARVLVPLLASVLIVGGYLAWHARQKDTSVRTAAPLEPPGHYRDLCCCHIFPEAKTPLDQALKSYDMAKGSGDHRMTCLRAYCVAQAYLGPASKEQFRGPTTTDLESHRKWKAIEVADCAAAGMMPQSD